jgi:competence protein ComEC
VVLEKPKLFLDRREFVLVMVVLILIVAIRLGWEYRSYRMFVQLPLYYTHAIVVNTYPKERDGTRYTILKLHTDQGKTVFTTTYRHDDLLHKKLYLQLLPSPQIRFWNYLGGLYCKSRIKRVETAETTIRVTIGEKITEQHLKGEMQAFYRAIFLADPIPKVLRTRIASLGISHLVALSGFHLGILWGLLYGVILLVYRPFQQRYFPYRHALLDIGTGVLVVLGVYLWLTGFPPSLVRSYAMLLVGWWMVLMGIELVSFTFLTTIALGLLALFPSLIVSLGFWLSIAGVFYIFLVLLYCHETNKWVVSLVCIPVGIFVLMQPLVHGVFGLTTPWQLLSSVLSIGFILFYPLAMVLHLVGAGGWLDGALTWLFALPGEGAEKLIPMWGVAGYVALSVLAIGWRWGWYVLLGIATGVTGYLFGDLFLG